MTDLGIVRDLQSRREPDELGIVTALLERRMKYGRYAYRAPAILPSESPLVEPDLESLVRAAVEKYMGSAAGQKKLERAITSAFSDEMTRWRNKWLASPEIADRVSRYSVDQVLEIAAQITGVPSDAMRGPTRVRSHAWPRHFAMTLLHCARRDLSYPVIGKIFGGRDHSTIKHALNKMLERRLYPECAAWFADQRAVEIFKGSEYAAEMKSGAEQ